MSAVGMFNLLRRLESARAQLASHTIYESLKEIEDVKVFMEHHVFAVWDFMSLLKWLQINCTCVTVPWVSVGSPRVRRLINEIVLEEETDEIDGIPVSHFELYRRAMQEIGADTEPVDALNDAVRAGTQVDAALHASGAPAGAVAFVRRTFEIIETGKPHMVAAAFTFGREDPIPGMFRTLIGTLQTRDDACLRTLITYLERHIGLDEDHHAPMAVDMLAELCGDDPLRWQEAADAAIAALSARISLWSVAASEISLHQLGVPSIRAA